MRLAQGRIATRRASATLARKPTAGIQDMHTWSSLRSLTPIFFLIGSLLHWDVYGAVSPAILMLAIAMPFWLVSLLSRKKSDARTTYSFLVAAYWLAAGLVIWLEGPTKLAFNTIHDDQKFYALLATGMAADTLEGIRLQTEGQLAVLAWRYLYGLAEEFGMPRWPVIAISLNIVAMAAAGALSVKTVESVCGVDRQRSLWVSGLYVCCGLFLLSATYHMRDAYPTLAIAALAHVWVRYLVRRTSSNFLILVVASPIFAFILYYLRTEFVFVPITFVAASLGALVVARDIRGAERAWINILVLLGMLTIAIVLSLVGSEALQHFNRGTDAYSEFAAQGAGADSLGMALFVRQPLPVKLVVGPLYVMLMPLPIWSGFMAGSAYHVFKSMGAAWFYFMGPAFGVAILHLLREPRARLSPTIFLLAGFGGFLILIGATSAESRHLGAFAPLLVAAVTILSGEHRYRRQLKRTVYAFALVIALAHLVWLLLKGT